MTKGAFDWQALFTQAPLGEEEFEPVRRRVEGMLEALPALFPGHAVRAAHPIAFCMSRGRSQEPR